MNLLKHEKDEKCSELSDLVSYSRLSVAKLRKAGRDADAGLWSLRA